MMAWGMDAGAWIWMFIWIVALISMVWLIVGADSRKLSDDPESILRARFARGEISADEFERATLVLRHGTGSTR